MPTSVASRSSGGASVYPSVQNLLLAARSEGLGTALTTLLCALEPQVKELLGIPDGIATAATLPWVIRRRGSRAGFPGGRSPRSALPTPGAHRSLADGRRGIRPKVRRLGSTARALRVARAIPAPADGGRRPPVRREAARPPITVQRRCAETARTTSGAGSDLRPSLFACTHRWRCFRAEIFHDPRRRVDEGELLQGARTRALTNPAASPKVSGRSSGSSSFPSSKW